MHPTPEMTAWRRGRALSVAALLAATCGCCEGFVETRLPRAAPARGALRMQSLPDNASASRGKGLKAHAISAPAGSYKDLERWGFPPQAADAWSSLDSCEFGGFGVRDINTMDELVSEITQALRYDVPLMRQMEAKRAMMRAKLPQSEYERFALFDENQPYTRNLVATDNDTFVLLLLCWSPGQVSKIHDHPCEGCWMRVMGGTVEERLYNDAGGRMIQTGFSRYQTTDVAFVDDCVGYHSIGNPSKEHGAMTLHLYSPPFEYCRAWPDKDDSGNVCHPFMSFHSEFGELC